MLSESRCEDLIGGFNSVICKTSPHPCIIKKDIRSCSVNISILSKYCTIKDNYVGGGKEKEKGGDSYKHACAHTQDL